MLIKIFKSCVHDTPVLLQVPPPLLNKNKKHLVISQKITIFFKSKHGYSLIVDIKNRPAKISAAIFKKSFLEYLKALKIANIRSSI